MTQEELIKAVGKVIPAGMYSKEMVQLAFTMFTHGYQDAIDKACEVIARLYPEAAAYYEQPETFVEQIRKAMEE